MGKRSASSLAIHVLLALVHFRLHELSWALRQIFGVDEEDSFPNWNSSIALFLTSFVLWMNARGLRAVGSPQRWYWLGWPSVFCCSRPTKSPAYTRP